VSRSLRYAKTTSSRVTGKETRRLVLPTEFSPEFNKPASTKIFLMKAERVTMNQLQYLRFIIAHRYYQLTPYRKLFDQRPGQIGSTGSDDNGIVRRMLGPAYGAISYV
jgi:hypothetical protein